MGLLCSKLVPQITFICLFHEHDTRDALGLAGNFYWNSLFVLGEMPLREKAFRRSASIDAVRQPNQIACSPQ